jgi:hypothetical protein
LFERPVHRRSCGNVRVSHECSNVT